jgi:hypothetical protein
MEENIIFVVIFQFRPDSVQCHLDVSRRVATEVKLKVGDLPTPVLSQIELVRFFPLSGLQFHFLYKMRGSTMRISLQPEHWLSQKYIKGILLLVICLC